MNDWQRRLKDIQCHHGAVDTEARRYAEANAKAVARYAAGQGPDSDDTDTDVGIRMVVNIASANVPDFCKDGYKNGYDLGKYRLGSSPGGTFKLREIIDEALPVQDPSRVYFGAAALSGSGIRFYGDICFVLKAQEVPDDTVVLDRNSYDLTRPPLADQLPASSGRKQKAKELSANWDEVSSVATVKVLAAYGPRTRRLTAGQIADAMLDDEDYIEVLKIGSFSSGDLQEVRLSSAEVASANRIEQKQSSGPPPSLGELQYLDQRRRAVDTLWQQGIEVVTVTTSGRIR